MGARPHRGGTAIGTRTAGTTAPARARGLGTGAASSPGRRRQLPPPGRWRLAALRIALVATLAAAAGASAAAASSPAVLSVGAPAPGGSYTTIDGSAGSVAALHGHTVLLWFVTTWCQHCQAGTRTLASAIDRLTTHGVQVVELESSGNFGRSGPSLAAFRKTYAGSAATNPQWTWGTASKAMTEAYDPGGYDNVYYLVEPDGHISYVNASPSATLPKLMTAVIDLSRGFTGGIGPEGVPEPAGPLLAGLGQAAAGRPVDGISCSRNEQLVFHVHTLLTVYVDGKPEAIPAGVGIAPPRSAQTSPYGAFVDGGSCLYWLHTHAKDGIIHIESPTKRSYTLGQFFDLWGQPLGPGRVGPAKGAVTAYVDGKPYSGNPRDIQLGDKVQIQLDVGTPTVAPRSIDFPRGL